MGGGGQTIADCISGSREATNMKNCSTHILWTPKVTVCSKVLHYGTAKVFVFSTCGRFCRLRFLAVTYTPPLSTIKNDIMHF